ncbi:hypothetical protein LCI18_002556 [Fusarium solani-melongenae]|uniref:Uncharacterized protein n=1 Tax=Fusarium solani subsp. cucurbitae TaxID=2747967 RepID=A0ACD3YRW3_FUSSC|nr:hypothetical protein LCI18_002556 [Fusarium solani-melongenae]
MALLTARDAVHVDDLERYDEFMKTITGNEILNFYPENQVIKLDIHEYPSNEIIRSGEFKPSPKADTYFKQEDELQAEFLQGSSGEGELEARGVCPIADDPVLQERANSRCFQFCGYVNHCVDRRCHHCYYVRGGCQWQKWCRA